MRPVRFKIETHPWSDESLVWYVIRVRTRSGVDKWSTLTKILGRRGSIRVIELVASEALLARLGQMAYVGGESLGESAGRITGIKKSLVASAAHLNMRGVELPLAAWMLEKVQMCPSCLAERGYMDYDADFSHVPVCTIHQSALQDSCPQCGETLATRATHIVSCGMCGYDFRRTKPHSVSPQVVALAEAILRCEPLPFRSEHGEMGLSPIEVYRLVEIAAMTEAPVPIHDLDSQWFNLLGWQQRLVHLEKLSQAYVDGQLQVEAVRQILLRPFRFLGPFEQNRARFWKLRELATGEELGGDANRMLLYGGAGFESHFAAYRMGQSLQEAMTACEAAAIVGVTEHEFHALKQYLYLSEPLEDEGYDGDELLHAREFVETAMEAEALDEGFGIPGITQLLYQAGLLNSWRPSDCIPFFGMPDVINFLSRLQEKQMQLRQTASHGAAISLGSLPTILDGRPEQALGAIHTILENRGPIHAWVAPYRLADIQLEGPFEQALSWKQNRKQLHN
jgi:hypothetical protein